jgi:polar amino acid transport system substrate-binding protein
MFKDIENFGNIPEIIRYHHERWDGKGYPDGLKGEEIPVEARILAIADAFDAMTSNRPYRTKLTVDEAINQIIKYSGKQFDPELAKIFVEMLTNNPEFILEDN